MDEQTIAITGVGPVSALGIGKQSFQDNLYAGHSCGRRLDEVESDLSGLPFDLTDIQSKVGAPIIGEQEATLNNEIDQFLTHKQQKRISWGGKTGAIGCKLALRDAGFSIEEDEEGTYSVAGLPSKETGVFVGTNLPGVFSLIENHKRFEEQGARRVSPYTIPKGMPNHPASIISLLFNLRGPSTVTSTACASGNDALAAAIARLSVGEIEAALIVGAESTIVPMIMAGFDSLQATSRNNDNPQGASRPFDEKRDGFVFGEGAGALLLEKTDNASDRAYAHIGGYGSTNDSHHLTAPIPSGDGAAESMEKAIAMAPVDRDRIDYINAHGTSTPMNDPMETRAIRDVFGERADDLMVSSLKSQIGHSLGASAILEAIATALTIRNDRVPPTINYENPDEECDLDYVPNEARKARCRAALSNSFGFGGHNTSILFKEP